MDIQPIFRCAVGMDIHLTTISVCVIIAEPGGAQCQLLFNISDNYILTSAEWPPGSVTVSGAR